MISSHRFVPPFLVAVAMCLAVGASAQTAAAAQQTAPAAKPAAQAAAPAPLPAPGTTTIKATVAAIDAAARKVTVKTDQGTAVTLGVPESIAPFPDLKVGDVVTVSYVDYQITKVDKVPPPPPPAPGWEIASKDGSTAIKVGFLAQPQYEALETATHDGYAQNLFLRRIRVMFGGRIAKKWLYFFETDSPNLGKGAATGTKDGGDVYIQDAYFTFDAMNAFKVDAGMILVPMSWNHTQSAASLLPVDYGPYTFIENGPMQGRVGRDYGVMLRGYPLKQRIEYRVGVFQGVRGADADNAFRFTARGQVNLLSADTGFFHMGTAQGTRQILSFGAFYDNQKDYQSAGFDGFLELNVKKMFGVSGQFNWVRTDGGDFLKTLPKQDTFLIEAGVTLAQKFTPFIQYATRNFDSAASADQNNLQVGIAYWMARHNRNLKFSIGRQHTDGQEDRTQALLQLQLFYF